MNAPAAGFDPCLLGTPDAAWRAALASCPAWAPRVGALVVISPHPDDETLAAGGLIHTWARLGHRTTIISITDGEAAYPSWPKLDAVRRRELGAALRVLGKGSLHSIRLGIPDGQAAHHKDRIRAAIESAVDGPTTLVCPYEHDGHPDHEAAARACLEVAAKLDLPVARYPVWMWHQAGPAALNRLRCGRFWLDRDSETVKSRAVACYASQTSPPRLEPIIPGHVLRYLAALRGVPRMMSPSSGDAVPPEIFERLYRERADPWDFAHSSYERDRYDRTLGALLRPRYGRAFEPGCSVGELTVQLAQRCGWVVATDIVESAVTTARFRCRHQLNVSISRRSLANGAPGGPFDLVVLSEVGYYFSRPKLAAIARDIVAQMSPRSELLAVHWLGRSPDHLLHGDEVHEVLGKQLGLTWIKGERTEHFRHDTWVAP